MKTVVIVPLIAIALLQGTAAHAMEAKTPIPSCNKNMEDCREWIDAVNEMNSLPSYPSGPTGGMPGNRPGPAQTALVHCINYQVRAQHLTASRATALCKKLLNMEP